MPDIEHPDAALHQLAEEAVERMANDTRTEEQKIADGADFIVNGGIGDDPSPDAPHPERVEAVLRAYAQSTSVDRIALPAAVDDLMEMFKERE